MVAFTQRNVYDRNGCSQIFAAMGKISAGLQVRVLPAKRCFHKFSREYVLIEYLTPTGDGIAGWMLPLDVGFAPSPSAMVKP
jgi:hypothetical protein